MMHLLQLFWALYYVYVVAVMLGTGYYLSHRDIAVISNSATNNKLDDKAAYDILVRSSFSFGQIGEAVAVVCS